MAGHRRHGAGNAPNRRELRKRRDPSGHLPQAAPNIGGPGELRCGVEQTFGLLHKFNRLAVHWERRTEFHKAFISLACSLICWRRLNNART